MNLVAADVSPLHLIQSDFKADLLVWRSIAQFKFASIRVHLRLKLLFPHDP